MKSKEELKRFFENGDIPKQEEFWEWQESYWHKNEKIPADNLDLDISQKANVDASNLDANNTQHWKDKIESQTFIHEPQLNGNILTVYYTGENQVQQSKSVNLGSLNTNDINIRDTEYDAAQNIITIHQNNGSTFHIDLSEFSIISTANTDGSISLIQEGVEKVQLKKVAISGSYNDLTDKPNVSISNTLQSVTTTGNTTDRQLVLNGSILEYNSTLGSHRFGGNSSSNTIGAKSVIYGALALNSNTTGTNNTAIGYNVLNANTTGHRNTAVGIWAGELITTGWNNTLLGNSSASRLTTGYDNIIIGRTSGYGITTGNNNITIGNNTGEFADKIKSNNVIIGSITGGGDEISNKLVIHNENLPATTSNPNGTPLRRNWNYALVYGDFAEKWLTLDSSLQVKRLPVADSSFTQNIVAKPDGTFGLSSKPYTTYTALLDFNQTTFEPAIRVLENTLVGDIVWTRLSTGQYEGKLAGGFVRTKTWIHVGANQFGEQAFCIYLDNNTVLLKTVNMGGDTVDPSSMFGIIEIRVYQ